MDNDGSFRGAKFFQDKICDVSTGANVQIFLVRGNLAETFEPVEHRRLRRYGRLILSDLC